MSTATAGRTSRTKSMGRRATSAGRKTGRSTSTSGSRSGGSRSGPTGTMLAAVNQAVGSSLTESLNAVKTRIGERITGDGEQYLQDASERISEVTAKVVKWGKEHPVKSAAAAAALIAVSTFLYSTLGKSSGGSRRK